MKALILRELLNKAIDEGDPHARYIVGGMYFSGDNVSEDTEEALMWFKLSADSGYAKAQFALANIIYHEEGVVADELEGLYWYQQAANQGHKFAQMIVNLIEKQEMTRVLTDRSPLVAPTLTNPNQ